MTSRNRPKHIPFSEIFRRKDKLIIAFSEDFLANYNTLNKILGWVLQPDNENRGDESLGDGFKNAHFMFPDFQISFFKHLLAGFNVNVSGITSNLPVGSSQVVINFHPKNKMLKTWSKPTNNVLMGFGKYVNVNFLPPPKDIESILIKTGEILSLNIGKGRLDVKTTYFNPQKVKDSPTTGKHIVIVNNFWNRILINNRLTKKFNIGSSYIINCSTGGKSPFSAKPKLDLKEIVDLCFGATKIITDEQSMQDLLKILGLSAVTVKRFKER